VARTPSGCCPRYVSTLIVVLQDAIFLLADLFFDHRRSRT
jgi:hypothetical protein